MKQQIRWTWLLSIALTGLPAALPAQRQMEKLDRGIIAINQGDSKVYVGWRLLGDEPENVAFNLYRTTDGGAPVKLNAAPLRTTTDFVDTAADLSKATAYNVRAVVNGSEQAADKAFTLPANAPVRQYLPVPIAAPPPTETFDGRRVTFGANDASVADLDGDGQYEIILKWDPSVVLRPAQTGFSGPQIYDAYKLDGTRLWRINLGHNIRSAPAVTQFMVYDLDGDGKAEMVCRTADGTIDGTGKPIGDPTKDWRNKEQGSPIYGKMMEGPEFFTVFNGQTGAAMASTEYVPNRYPIDGWGGLGGNGGTDSNGNRVDHFASCIAYLDGQRPSVVMLRGGYGRTVLVAWDWRDGKLTQRWIFDSGISYPPFADASTFSGQGNHQITVGDFDGDGKDEVCFGGAVIDDNGKGLASSGTRHGDALHAGDLDPNRPGMEIFKVSENEGSTVALQTPGSLLYDPVTGKILWGNNPGRDVGRGMAADIDPNFPGVECWGAPGGLRRVDTGEPIYEQTPNSVNFAVWWDDDLLRELLDRNVISKWDWEAKQTRVLLTAEGATSNNGTKATPCLSGDILGDWREEVIFRNLDSTELRIYTTTIPAKNRIYTLMHDPQYRLAIAWQNVAYNQPPHPGFFLGHGMKPAPRPNIVTGR